MSESDWSNAVARPIQSLVEKSHIDWLPYQGKKFYGKKK